MSLVSGGWTAGTVSLQFGIVGGACAKVTQIPQTGEGQVRDTCCEDKCGTSRDYPGSSTAAWTFTRGEHVS